MAGLSPAQLAQWTSRARARNGTQICIRPLRPDDREREVAFIASLSERTRYLRMFTPLRFLPPHMVDEFMDIDYRDRMALIASVGHDHEEQFVGVARYGLADEPATVELGVTVTDAWQRQGIARLLVGQLLRFARSRHFRRICGMVLPENLPMLELAKTMGFHSTYDSRQHLIRIEMDLGAA